METTVVEDTGWEITSDGFDPGFGTSAEFEAGGLGPDEVAEQVEPGSGPVSPGPCDPIPLCFIDGRRRVELSLWQEHTNGDRVPGLAGAYAVGAVVIAPGRLARYAGIRVGRLAIWGGGHHRELRTPTGYIWAAESTTVTEHVQLLAHLQERMRQTEGALALDAARLGWNVVLDGPLNRIRSLHELVTGYVKSHVQPLLGPAEHAAVPALPVGSRTRIHTAGTDRYTCYLRVGAPRPGQSRWTGIARLDFPAVAGLTAVADRADQLAFHLPRYAGIAHRDQRAPVNLTPVKNLEGHLSHVLGPVELATRSARDAIARARRNP